MLKSFTLLTVSFGSAALTTVTHCADLNDMDDSKIRARILSIDFYINRVQLCSNHVELVGMLLHHFSSCILKYKNYLLDVPCLPNFKKFSIILCSPSIPSSSIIINKQIKINLKILIIGKKA